VDPASKLLPSGVDLLSAPVGGVWIDGEANHDPTCRDEWNGPHGSSDAVVDVELIQLTARGALFRVPADARVGDVYAHSIVCGLARTEGADHHVIAGELPTRAPPRITSATTRQQVFHVQHCNLVFGPPDAQTGYVGTEDLRNNLVDAAVNTEAPALIVEQWKLAHGARPGPGDFPEIGAVDVVVDHVELNADGNHVDIQLRLVDLPRGTVSNAFTVPIDLGCSSTAQSASTLAGLALLLGLSRRGSRRS
jgi:hypothetical protein